MIIQLCQVKVNRRSCGRKAKVWIEKSYRGFGNHVTKKTYAACDRCAEGETYVGPVEVTQRATACTAEDIAFSCI